MGSLPPSWSTGVLPMPFLAFLLGETGLQRWKSLCPGPLGHWDAHPSPTHPGCPFLAWPAHCRPWELLSLPPLRSSFPEAAGGILLLEVLFPQILPSHGFTPTPPLPLAHPSHLLPWPRVVHLHPGVKGLLSPQGSSCFRRGSPLCFLAASCSALSPLPHLPQGWGGAGRGFSVFLCFPENWFAHPCVGGWTVP